ncbi:M20/M25/M40 family metallo-hydrolase [Shewanella surugensis]|uniref:Carboxypeptidase Q n=2 Tax=Shewanella surugensis TaxID=212020 RepID=A0ABT0L5U8_9GAMM|nr:M20/M25/M40 family metallo-hydrolase [Shewanella surugensis]MCL1123061.1 M20/M25/M40 family metallo-hydrolase [Shewanella surugensis]
MGCQNYQSKIESNVDVATKLKQQAFQSPLAYDLIESLTVEVGPRLTGSEKDRLAVQWVERKLNTLGFDKVYKEAVEVPVWNRGAAKAEVIAPFQQPLVITALGGSIGTPQKGIQANIIRFKTLDALKAASITDVKGKIVFIDHKTQKTVTGAGYGETVSGRSKGAIVAAEKGAVAILIRSIGTDSDRMAHTGIMKYVDGIQKIPAAAMSNPDADLINAMLQREPIITLSLNMSSARKGVAQSFNVIAEVTGQQKPDEIVLISAHLDSWDEGTGALDDGAGVAIVTAAAKLIQDLPKKPARTIRLVLFAAEEVGIVGAKAYIKAHEKELGQHYIAAESDFGAGLIYQLDLNVSKQAFHELHRQLNPMASNGVKQGNNTAHGGPDVSIFPSRGIPVASLRQNGFDYFNYHHTPNDTLDKIDPKKLQQNVAAYAQFAYLMAQSTSQLRPMKSKQ